MITEGIRVFTCRGLLIRMVENLRTAQPDLAVREGSIERSILEVTARAVLLSQNNLLNAFGCRLNPDDISSNGETQGIIEVKY